MQNNSRNVLVIDPYFTEEDENFFLLASGFHFVGLPVTNDESNQINKLIARYYNLKGIYIK